MAATDKIFYFDYRNHSRIGPRQRRRLMIRLAHSSALSETTVPAWGADPAGGSNFVRIIGGISIPEAKDAQVAFEKWTIGLATSSIFGVDIDFAALVRGRSGATSTDLQGLAAGIRNENASAAGTLSFGSGLTRSFDTTNRWDILTDDGDSSLAITSFRTKFQGIQRVLPTREGEIIPTETVTESLELLHISRACFDTVTMQDVATYMLNSFTSFQQPDGDHLYDFNDVIDQVYSYSGVKYLWWCTPGSETRCKFYRLYDLFYAIEHLTRQAYIGHSRNASASVLFRGATVGGTVATPWDHWTFYQQTYLRTGLIGTALATTDLYLLGEIMLDGTRAGGLFHADESADTLANDKLTAWEFMSDCCSAALSRATFEQVTGTQFYLRIHKPLDSTVVRTITRADLINMEPGKKLRIPYKVGQSVVANVTVEVAGVRGEDWKTIPLTNHGSKQEQGGTIKTVFDTSPIIASPDDWTGGNFSPDNTPITTNFVGGAIGRYFTRKLYYMTDAGGILRATYPVRVHHAVTYSVGGVGASLSYTGRTLPTPALTDVDSLDGAEFRDNFRDPMRVLLAANQRTDSIGPVAGRQAISLFGKAKQSVYTVHMPATIADYDDGGNEYRFGPAVSGSYTAQALADKSSIDVSDLPGRCHLLNMKMDDDTDIAECELLGVRS